MRLRIVGSYVTISFWVIALAGITEQKPRHTSRNQIIQVCGYRSETGEDFLTDANRIVGGSKSFPGEFKWQVSMRTRRGSGRSHICGGTVIGTSWILTAAHCTKQHPMNKIEFVAGDYSLSVKEVTEQIRYPDLVFIHEEYDDVSQFNDISLVRLNAPFDFSLLTIAPACLPFQAEAFTGYCVVTGWGKQSETSFQNTNELEKVWVPIIGDLECREALKTINYDRFYKPSILCAGEKTGGKDACQGDSGGPLVCAGRGNLPMLAGIVSWGIGCGRTGVPGIYTKVSHYMNWIETKIRSNPPINNPLADPGIQADVPQSDLDTQLNDPVSSTIYSPWNQSSEEEDSLESSESSEEED